MASHVGNGLPPIRTNTDASQGARLLRDLAFAAVLALLAAAVVAGGIAFYPDPSDASRQHAQEAVLPGNQVVAESAAALEHAEKLDDLAEAGARARVAVADLELLDTRGIGDSQLRNAAKQLLRAQLALLSALEPLADLDESSVGEWRSHRRRIRAAVRQIERAHPAIAELDLTSDLNVWGPVLTWSLANADAVVATAARRLRTWRARVQEVRRGRREALAAITSYDSTVRGYLATYDGFRADLDDWIRRFDTNRSRFTNGSKFLRSRSTALHSVRNDMAVLEAPAGVASAHTNLLAFMDRAIASVSSARPRLRESTATRSRWQAAVAAEVRRIRSVNLPKRPDV
jgi:hypothetical protein